MPLRCELLVAGTIEELANLKGVGIESTGEVIEYEAISYTWGKPDFSATVTCNGLDLPVMRSAHEVLLHMRLPDKERYVWLDAICINQLDTNEKNAQVQLLMYRIYQRRGNVKDVDGRHC